MAQVNLKMSRVALVRFQVKSQLKKQLKTHLEVKMQLKKLNQKQLVTTVMTQLLRTSAHSRTSSASKSIC